MNSSGNGIANLPPSKQSTAKKQSHPSKTSPLANAMKMKQLNEQQERIVHLGGIMKDPEMHEIFNDLDLFITNQLNEVNVKRRVQEKLESKESFDEIWQVLMKLSEKYANEKERETKRETSKVQKDDIVEDQLNKESIPIDEQLPDERDSDMMKNDKIYKLQVEAVKEENLLTKINRALESIIYVNNENIYSIMNIERHYLVAGEFSCTSF